MNELAARGPIVTIDGPAGSGKTTVGRMLADLLGYMCLDSGIFYRAVALATIREGADPSSTLDAVQAATSLQLRVEENTSGPRGTRVYDGERDITEGLVSLGVEQTVSLVSRIPEVRTAMLGPQREVLREGRVVALGRDLGTVVAPDAEVKVYLEATLETRTQRRWKERLNGGENTEMSAVRDGLIARDRIDSQRDVAPLKAAYDAVIISTDDQAPRAIVRAIQELMAERGLLDGA